MIKAVDVFQWAVTKDLPTIAEAAAFFGVPQSEVESAVADAWELKGAYLGIVAAIRTGADVTDLRDGARRIEAYYAPDMLR